MDFTFPWPTTQGEWLAFGAAAVTVLFGLLCLFAPRLALRMQRLQARSDRPEALASMRAAPAGFPVALGLSCMLLDQPLIYMALGFAWLLSAFGRLVGILSDGGGRAFNLAMLVLELVLAALPLGLVFGFLR